MDTSTPSVTAGVVEVKQPHEIAAALADGGALAEVKPYAVLAERVVVDAFGHVENLMPMVTDVLAEASCAMADLGAVVAGVGPGPFTGLRVGMATAAALGDALDIPVHGVPSHDALARIAADTGEGAFLVVTDARRKEAYVTAYAEAGAALAGPVAIAPAAVPGWCAEHGATPEWIAGPGAGLIADAAGLPEREIAGSLAEGLVLCAAQALLTGVVPGPLTPLYLRRPDAVEPGAPKAVIAGGEPARP